MWIRMEMTRRLMLGYILCKGGERREGRKRGINRRGRGYGKARRGIGSKHRKLAVPTGGREKGKKGIDPLSNQCI